MKNAYFHINDAKKAGEKLVLSGNYVLPHTVEVNTSGGQTSSGGQQPKPEIKIPGPFKVKWILPPETSSFYGAVKSVAEGAGYETVEHDDFSYPPPRP